MRRLIATTAMALVMAGPAVSQMAEDQTMAEGGFYEVQMGDLFASELIGQEVYAARPAAEPGEMEEAEARAADEPPVDEAEVAADEAPTERTLTAAELGEMENIGQVSEIVFGRDGEVKAIAVGVGDRDVALSFDEIEFAADADDPAQVFIVTRTGADELENAPEFDRDAARRAEADPAMTPEEEDPAMAREEDPAVTEERLAEDPAVTEERLAEERAVTEWRQDRDAMVPPQVEREGYVLAEVAEMSVDSLIGANVYDAADENIGSVSDVVVSAEGQLEYVVIDVGGFLGFGTHTVAIGFDEMTVLHDEGWADLRVYVDVTQDRLEAMPEYQGVAN